MSEIQDSNTSSFSSELVLPSFIEDKAVFISREPAWVANDALEAINWLASSRHIVLGVELWLEENESPKWIASSNYSYDDEQNALKRISFSAQSARDFVSWGQQLIKKIGSTKVPLFNLDWSDKAVDIAL